MKNESDSVSSH